MDMLDLEKLAESVKLVEKIAAGVVDDQAYNVVTQAVNESVLVEAEQEVEAFLRNSPRIKREIDLSSLVENIEDALSGPGNYPKEDITLNTQSEDYVKTLEKGYANTQEKVEKKGAELKGNKLPGDALQKDIKPVSEVTNDTKKMMESDMAQQTNTKVDAAKGVDLAAMKSKGAVSQNEFVTKSLAQKSILPIDEKERNAFNKEATSTEDDKRDFADKQKGKFIGAETQTKVDVLKPGAKLEAENPEKTNDPEVSATGENMAAKKTAGVKSKNLDIPQNVPNQIIGGKKAAAPVTEGRNDKKFLAFVESLRDGKNAFFIEAVKEAYKVTR